MIKTENRFFFVLAFLMGMVVALSNYLVQFPVKYAGLQDIFTYGAFSYPIAFLITDLANRRHGKLIARKIVYIGFVVGIVLTLYFSTDFSNLISKRIAAGSSIAFLTSHLLDVYVFDRLRRKVWFVAPLASSLIGSCVDTFLFFSIAFYGTETNWITLSLGDLFVKTSVALLMLIPFRILLSRVQEISEIEKKINV
tara:strand:- start:609 stop:1196 length:588 start_codon:yes stop_codon:yes gene_type:complete